MSRVHEFVSLLLFSKFLALLLAAGDQGTCPPLFHCGYLTNFTFPFTTTERQDCGFLSIRNCDDDRHKIKFIQLPPNGKLFQVLSIAQVQLQSSPTTHFSTLIFRDKHFYDLLQNRSCEAFRNNYTLPHISDFVDFTLVYKATLFLCNHTLHVNPPTSINMSKYKCDDYDIYYKLFMTHDDKSSFKACKEVQLPIKDLPDATDPFSFITGDVTIKVGLTDPCSDCYYRQGGKCIRDSREKFCCVNVPRKGLRWKALALGLGIGIPCMMLIGLLLFCFLRNKRKHATSGGHLESKDSYSDSSSILDRASSGEYFGVPKGN